MRAYRRKDTGFTLVEILITVAVLGIMSSAVFGFFHSQQQVYLREDERMERDQNVRTALEMMTRELKMAGYQAVDPWVLDHLGDWVPARYIP
ncbi:MAG: prepilin-type N-terminal cleavage/methylation domain-containing protein, partial [Deltaproteobacteria bacterium]|nr:prepilin-type N-terminal cleavage/methylation domain-containing protein [Deltaproteobacteria bacterium]